jgi:hypothetical protein
MKAIVKVRNIQGRAEKDTAFLQIKNTDGKVTKFTAPSMWQIFFGQETTEMSFANTGTFYAHCDAYAIIELTDAQDVMRTGVLVAENGYYVIESVQNGQMIAGDWAILLHALGDHEYTELHTFIEGEDLHILDFWGWEIEEGHKALIIEALEVHKNGKEKI